MAKKRTTAKKTANGPATSRVGPFDSTFSSPLVPSGSKERILIAALDLLREKGFDGFSASELSRVSGLSKANLFHHFKTMEEIPLACLDLVRQVIRPRIDTARFQSLREFLLAYGEESVSFRAEKSFFRMMHFFGGRAMAHPAYEQALQTLIDEYIAWLTELMTRFLSKSVPTVAVLEMATLITIVLEGLAGHRALHGDKARLPSLWTSTVDMVVSRLESLS